MKEFTQGKNLMIAKFATKSFHNHQVSESMRKFIQEKNHINAKHAPKPFHDPQS